MYRAKDGAADQSVFFEPRMNADAIARVGLERELRHAIDETSRSRLSNRKRSETGRIPALSAIALESS